MATRESGRSRVVPAAMNRLGAITTVPDVRGRSIGLWCCGVVVFLLFAVYLLDSSDLHTTFFISVLIALAVHAVLTWRAVRGNLFIVIRCALLAVPTWLTALVRVVAPDSLFTAPFGHAYQDADASAVLVMAGTLATCASLAGWLWPGASSVPLVIEAPLQMRRATIGSSMGWACMAVLTALVYVWSSGGFVSGEKLYADGSQGLPFEFNIFGILQAACVAVALLGAREISRVKAMPIHLFAMGSFALCLLAGSRADYMPGLLLVFLLFIDPLRTGVWSVRRLAQMTMVFVVGFIAASAIAIWRFSSDITLLVAVGNLMDLGLDILFAEYNGHRVLWIETGNHMIGGFYGFIAQINDLGRSHLWGTSYLDYLLRLPPAFLGVPRPEGLEWQTDIDGLIMSQGGVWEPAEAWLNFGMVGCCVIPFLWSRLMRLTLDRHLVGGSTLWWIWYCIMGFLCVRTTWYQNFAFVRIASVIFVFWVLVMVFNSFAISRKKNLA